MERKVWYFRQLNLFAGVPAFKLESLVERMQEWCCLRGEAVIEQGASNDRIHLIKRGAVRLFRRSDDGREVTLAILRPGQVLGTLALLGTRRSDVGVQPLENTHICSTPADEFLRLMAGHPRKEEGLVEIGYRRIVVTDPDGLWRRAQPDAREAS